MPANQYDSTTTSAGNANDQSGRVVVEQQTTNDQQQQAQAAQRAAAPVQAVESQPGRQDQQVRREQVSGMSMGIW
jgi:hypothetical protein